MDLQDPNNFPAVFTVHTPSGTTDACVAHARALDRLMQMLGARTQSVKAPEGAVCANCLNEAKAGKGQA